MTEKLMRDRRGAHVALASALAVVSVGDRPFSLALGGDGQFLYVGNWGSDNVSGLATAT